MKIKFLTSIAGNADPANGLPRDFAFAHGQVAEVPDAIAARWVGSKIAVQADATKAAPAAAPKPSAKGK